LLGYSCWCSKFDLLADNVGPEVNPDAGNSVGEQALTPTLFCPFGFPAGYGTSAPYPRRRLFGFPAPLKAGAGAIGKQIDWQRGTKQSKFNLSG
jgi:hypothetical protein